MTSGLREFRRARTGLGVRTLVSIIGLLGLVVVPSAHAQFREGLQADVLQVPSPAPASSSETGYRVMSTMDGSVQRISVYWSVIAPPALVAGFDASNPADPHYRWTALDSAVKNAAAHHVQPILDFLHAPTWAEGPNRPTGPNAYYITPGSWDPNPSMFGQFVRAVTTRFSGTFVSRGDGKLPRVRLWEMWNEPNIPGYFAAPKSVDAYRTLLNTSYRVAKSVHQDNTVVFAGLAPVGDIPYSEPPLKFAAAVMCLRRVKSHFVRTGRCRQKARFDVLNHHPYAFASTPTKHAYRYDDLLVADMPKLRAALDAAQRLHTINGGPHQLWATEFSWPTNPPNTVIGDAPAVAARYVAYSLYEMWKAGTSLVIYSPIFDILSSRYVQNVGTGLLSADGTPKLTLNAFAFPFIASVHGRRGYAWGRVPVSHRVRVYVQHLTRHGWRRVASVRTGRDGIFTAHFAARGNGNYRAQVAHGQVSLTYFSARIPGKRIHSAPSSFG